MARPSDPPLVDPGGLPPGERSQPREAWELTLNRSGSGLDDSPCLLRILRPLLREIPRWLSEAAAAVGAGLATWGDRPAIAADPRALLSLPTERLEPDFRAALESLLGRRARRRFELELPGGRRLGLGDPPAIFGVINATPDSFSDGGRHLDPGRALEGALEMVRAGVDAIDVGGESTRPGAAPVDAEEERRRVEPVIRRIRSASRVPLSIDTTKAEVARMALDEGVDILNDVSALRDDPAMARLARERGVPVILMHRRGTPRDMQDDPRYDDVTREVYQFLDERVRALEAEGLDRERMVVDPGIGFGKRVEHNLALLRDVDELRSLGRPVLVGASRKSFMGRLLSGSPSGGSGPLPALEVSTLAAHAAAILGGAAAIRVHDVPAHRHLLRVLWAIQRSLRPSLE